MPKRNRIKVCILTSVHSPFNGRIFHKEAKTLVKAGYDVVLIAQHTKEETVDDIRIVPLPKPRNRFERMTKVTWKFFRLALKEKADVYHFHDPELIPVGLILKLFDKKVVYDVHEDYVWKVPFKYWIAPPFRKLLCYSYYLAEKLGFKFIDQIILASPGIETRSKGKNKVTIRNYPLILNQDKIDYSLTPDNKPYLLIYAGSLSRERGIKEIVQVMELIADKFDVKLRLIGKFESRKFEDGIRSLNGFKYVDYLGYKPWEEVVELLSKADLGLAISQPIGDEEVLPTKLFEYMSAGLPVITSNFPLRKELIEGNNCGKTIAPQNLKALGETIEYLLKRPKLREKMRENGRNTILEKYNWERESKKLLKIYEKLLRR